MRYKFFLILLILTSCSSNYTKFENREVYNSKGFAYIYNEEDFLNKKIKSKLDNSKLQVSVQKLRTNTLLKLINPNTKAYIILKNTRKIKYPDFYKILITQPVVDKLNIQKDLPLIEILEIRKNKSFIAKKAKIFKEEEKVQSKAPVTTVKISNISKDKKVDKKNKSKKMFILIATFYTENTANFLKQRIIKEIPRFDSKKLIVKKKSNTKINLISGPYSTINLMKNDYILLKNFGFEELDITINE